MEILTILAITIPSTISVVTSLIYAYIALKKLKEPPKDEVWETACKIICKSDFSLVDAESFEVIYTQLKQFKENSCSETAAISDNKIES